MPLSSRSVLSWGPTPIAADAQPGLLNLSSTASTTAYHSTPSCDRLDSYTHSSATGTGNTFDTSQSSLHDPGHNSSTLPGSDAGAAPSAGFHYRWKSGVVSRTPGTSLPSAAVSKPQRLLTRHVTPLLPISEELLCRGLAEIPVHQECSVLTTVDAADVSCLSTDDRQSSECLNSTSDPVSVSDDGTTRGTPTYFAPLRHLLLRCVRQDGTFYIQQVQIRCKSAKVLPHPCERHTTVDSGCRACCRDSGTYGCRVVSPKHTFSFVDTNDNGASPQLSKWQLHWTDGGNTATATSDAAAGNAAGRGGSNGGGAATERYRLAGSSPFSSPHPVGEVDWRSGACVGGSSSSHHRIPLDNSDNSNIHNADAPTERGTTTSPSTRARDAYNSSVASAERVSGAAAGVATTSNPNRAPVSTSQHNVDEEFNAVDTRGGDDADPPPQPTSTQQTSASPLTPHSPSAELQLHTVFTAAIPTHQPQQRALLSSEGAPRGANISFSDSANNDYNNGISINVLRVKTSTMPVPSRTSVTAVSSQVSLPLYSTAVGIQHHFVTESIHFQELLATTDSSSDADAQERSGASMEAGELSRQTPTWVQEQPEQQARQPQEEEEEVCQHQQEEQQQCRFAVVATQSGFVSTLSTSLHSLRNESPLNGRASNVVPSMSRPLFGSSTSTTTGRQIGCGGALSTFTPKFVSASALNTRGGGNRNTTDNSDRGVRDGQSGMTNIATPVTAAVSQVSPLVFRAIQPELPARGCSNNSNSVSSSNEGAQPLSSASASSLVAYHSTDDVAAASLNVSHAPDWAMGRKPPTQLREHNNTSPTERTVASSAVGSASSFHCGVVGADGSIRTLIRGRAPFMASTSTAASAATSATATGPLLQPGFTVPSRPVSAARIMSTTATSTPSAVTAALASPPFRPPALSGAEERTLPSWRTPNKLATSVLITTAPQSRKMSFASYSLPPASSPPTGGGVEVIFDGEKNTDVDRVTIMATTTTLDNIDPPSAPHKSVSNGCSTVSRGADESLAATRPTVFPTTASSASITEREPSPAVKLESAVNEVRDTGVLLVVPAGIVVTSNTSVATDRFSWTTTAPPDAALAVVERHVQRTAAKAKKTEGLEVGASFLNTFDHRNVCSACLRPAGEASLCEEEVVENVVTYFPVHTDVLKKRSGFFVALFGDSGSPYVRSVPDEYVDLADLPRTTTEAVLHVDRPRDGAAERRTYRFSYNGDVSGVDVSTAKVVAASNRAVHCSCCRCWSLSDDIRSNGVGRGSSSGCSSCAFTGALDSRLPFDAHPAVHNDAPSSTCVPVYYVRGPGCDGSGFVKGPWMHSRTGGSVAAAADAADEPQLTANSVAQLIHYFYTGALPLFHNHNDIISARGNVLEASAISGFARQFAEIFFMGYYASLNSLTQAMLNVLWRLLSVAHNVLPMWSTAVKWRLPDVQALCEQWIAKHLSAFLRNNTERGLWRGLHMSHVELLMELRMSALRTAKARETERAAAVDAPLPALAGSPAVGGSESEGAEANVTSTTTPADAQSNNAYNSNGYMNRSGATNGRYEASPAAAMTLAAADTRAPQAATGAAPLFYGWPVTPTQPQPLSIGNRHPLRPPAYADAPSPTREREQYSGPRNTRTPTAAIASAGRIAPPPPPTLPQAHARSSPVSSLPARQASRHYEPSPVNSFASSRRRQNSSIPSWFNSFSARRSPPLSAVASMCRDSSVAEVGRSTRDGSGNGSAAEAGNNVETGMSPFASLTGVAASELSTAGPHSNRTATSTATATVTAPPLIPVATPVSRPTSSPLMLSTVPWPASRDRSSASNQTGTSIRNANGDSNTLSGSTQNGPAAQQFWTGGSRHCSFHPMATSAATTTSASGGTHSSTPWAFEEMDTGQPLERRSGITAAAAAYSGHGATMTQVFSAASNVSVAPRHSETARAPDGYDQQQRDSDVAGLRSGASPHPLSPAAARSRQSTSNNVSLPAPLFTRAARRNSCIHFNAFPTHNSGGTVSPPTLYVNFAAIAGATATTADTSTHTNVTVVPRNLPDDSSSRIAPGLHSPNNSNSIYNLNSPSLLRQQQGNGFRSNFSSTPHQRSSLSSSFSSTSWMVVPPTLQLLADGAWRIGGYGRLYTIETREALEERQASWLQAEHEQHREDAALDEVLLSEEELLERLWTWWATYNEDAANTGHTVDAEERAAMAAMLREIRLPGMREAAFASTETMPASCSTSSVLLEDVECFLNNNPPPL